MGVKPSFRSFHSSTFSFHQVESAGLHELGMSGTHACAHPHTEPPRERTECRAVWLTCCHILLITASRLSQLRKQQLTTNRTFASGAERAEAVSGASAPLSLFSPPPLSPPFQKITAFSPGCFCFIPRRCLCFLFVCFSAVSHSVIWFRLPFFTPVLSLPPVNT